MGTTGKKDVRPSYLNNVYYPITTMIDKNLFMENQKITENWNTPFAVIWWE